ncbi:MAG: helix-turn-helix domain-containing protein [Candidatus Parvarchaeota archaeon]|jgi:transposase|nr:helix-turn-helix domain-containing protein [Candidatus Parvarchaeota archaeon]MCL5106689.1 helix-turn-helix domain-containing protein [Candidatus Parvarchaeota archaeon]
MLTAYKFRLYPNEEQKETFSKYFGCNRVIWTIEFVPYTGRMIREYSKKSTVFSAG